MSRLEFEIVCWQNPYNAEDQRYWIISGASEMSAEIIGTHISEAGNRDFLCADAYHSARVVSEEAIVYLVGKKVK